MKKSMEKLQVRINQNLNRTEKTVALPLELEKIGRNLNQFEVVMIVKIIFVCRGNCVSLQACV